MEKPKPRFGFRIRRGSIGARLACEGLLIVLVVVVVLVLERLAR